MSFVPVDTRSLDSPRVNVSHLLDLLVCPDGRRTRNASKQSFISLRRLRSASLCVTRNSGVRL